MKRPRFFGKTALHRDVAGAAMVEFAIIVPVFLMLIMGALDLGHTLYARAILVGQLQKAGRDSGLDMNSGEASQGDLDTRVRNAVKAVAGNASFTFKRTAFYDYELAQSKAEPIQADPFMPDGKTPNPLAQNSVCDIGEKFEDKNHNGVWDEDAGKTGQGGGKDAVIYTVVVQYPRLFPMPTLGGWSDTVALSGTTVLRNQPYENQPDPVVLPCK